MPIIQWRRLLFNFINYNMVQHVALHKFQIQDSQYTVNEGNFVWRTAFIAPFEFIFACTFLKLATFLYTPSFCLQHWSSKKALKIKSNKTFVYEDCNVIIEYFLYCPNTLAIFLKLKSPQFHEALLKTYYGSKSLRLYMVWILNYIYNC